MLDQEMIRTFIQVADCQSFTKAAEMLHKTSAAISYRIKTLEENIGTQLFNRTTRTVTLTPAGEYLLEKCRQWIVWLESMPIELQQMNAGVEYQVNIVINNLLYDRTAVASMLACLHQRFPSTQFHITRQVYMGVWDALINEDYHFAIGVTGNESLKNNINICAMGEIQWQFVVAPNHPLANVSGVLSDDQMRIYSAVNVEDTSRHLSKRTAWRLSGQHEIKVPDLHTKLACHLKGVGIGFLPLSLCKPLIDSGQLIAKEVKNRRHNSPLSLAWCEDKKGAVVSYLVDLFRQGHPSVQSFYDPLN